MQGSVNQGYTLRVLEASEPAHPTELARLRFNDCTTTMALRWPALYVGSENHTRVFDVADPAHPQLRTTLDGGRNLTFNFMGDYLLTENNANRELGFTVYDVSNPANPLKRLSGERYIGMTNPNQCFFASDGKRLFQVTEDKEDRSGKRRVAIQDVTASPTTLGWRSIRSRKYEAFTVQKGQLVAGDTASTGTIPLTRVDPATTVWVYNGDGLSIAQDGRPVKAPPSKIACEQTGHELKIFENTGATSPTLRCVYGEHAGAVQIKLDGQRGYLLDGDGGLQILDLAAPAQPRCLARYPLGIKEPVIRSAADGLVFIGGAEMASLRMINCANPTSPTLCGEYRGGAGPMSVQGHRAYIAAGDAGLQILDISDPQALQLLGRYPTPSPTTDLVTSGTLAYVLADKLLVVDTTNPAKPVLVGSTPLGLEEMAENYQWLKETDVIPQVLKRLGPALYVAGAGGRHEKLTFCQVVDVTIPNQPHPLPDPIVAEPTIDEVATQASKAKAANVMQQPKPGSSTYAGWFLGLPASHYSIHDFSSYDEETMSLFDLTDPLHPRLASNYNAYQSSEGGVTLRKGLIYHADGLGGLVILRPAR